MSKKSLWQFTRASILAFLIIILISFSTVAYSQLNIQNKCQTRDIKNNGISLHLGDEPRASTILSPILYENGKTLIFLNEQMRDDKGQTWFRVRVNMNLDTWIRNDKTIGCN